MIRRRFRRPARVAEAAGEPRAGEHAHLLSRLDEQDAAAARLRLALDEAVLALDTRMLDHYALTELARAEMHQRLAAIDLALASADGPVAELIGAEASRIDAYLMHHAAILGQQIGAARTVAFPSAPDIDLVLLAGGFDIVIPSLEQGLIAYVLRHGFEKIEPGVRAALLRELRPGAVAVDAGANIGLHALGMAAAVGPDGRMICFEPVPRLAVSLRRTLALNGFAARSEVRAMALAESEGVAVFHVAEHSPMSSLFALPGGAASVATEVERSTLDAQFPAGTHIDLVKLDVEGAEPLVWRGSERVRSENPDVVFVLEWSAPHLVRGGFAPAEVMAEIRAAGFAPFLIATDDPAGVLTPLDADPETLMDGNLLLRRA